MDEFYVYRWNGTKAEVLIGKVDNGLWTPLQEVGLTNGTWDHAVDLKKHGFVVMACGASITPDRK